ncbi:glycoside hydrolase family 95 protein [Salibacterium sp. K-3]
MKLIYNRPAEKWTEALPIGNGKLGAMVFGQVTEELIQCNEETLWSGYPKDNTNHAALDILPEVRKKIQEHEYSNASDEAKNMLGAYTQAYLPLCDIMLGFPRHESYSDFKRELDLNNAVAKTSYNVDGVHYTRSLFASFPDNIIAMRLTADHPASLHFSISMSSKLKHHIQAEKKELLLKGQCPEHVDPIYYDTENPVIYGDPETTHAMSFEARVHILSDGRVTTSGQTLHVEEAESAIILFTAATNYSGFDSMPGSCGKEPSEVIDNVFDNAILKSYPELFHRHKEDYQLLFHRVTFDLKDSKKYENTPTDERIQRYGAQDKGLIKLLFHYARYLMIASSREGTQPATLQGIWNKDIRAPWSSNYTLNINAEMNYWASELLNLPECHLPFLNYIEDLAAAGKYTAAVHYGCRGWTAHHNSDIWRHTAPVGDYGHGDPVWALWPMGGVWLTRHLWEHYLYTMDETYLKNRAYPILKQAALFCLEWVIKNKDGFYITSPSTSPEHHFIVNGYKASVTNAATMDMALIWDVFTNTLSAQHILGIDYELQKEIESTRANLYPYQVGSYGELQEWDQDFMEEEPEHRHVSHLYGVYPGEQLTETLTPEWFESARASLKRRGDGGTGWSLVWKLCLWARFQDEDHAFRLIENLFHPADHDEEVDEKGGLYNNLFGAHPPFQIDGNFGYAAGIIELLIQSHQNYIHFLPSLPSQLPEGQITGVRVRGGFEVSIKWKNHEMIEASLLSNHGSRCYVYNNKEWKVSSEQQKVSTTSHSDGILAFNTDIGKTYYFKPKE